MCIFWSQFDRLWNVKDTFLLQDINSLFHQDEMKDFGKNVNFNPSVQF
jgi:hypothetical protein